MISTFLRVSLVSFSLIIGSYISRAQEQASGFGFNYFPRQWITDNSFGAGYSFYAAAWPIMQTYPGPENFQLGLPSTWLTPLESGNEPEGFYNTIEGGLGWWSDTRFATETPKFIMGAVANGFAQWANGTGAGSGDLRFDGHRDWSSPGGKYGIAQLSPYLLWPPDGLNIAQGANGEFLGYGYHPLPITNVMEETYGVDFSTGNQCWTLFLNAANFKGPITFILPTFWTETALEDPNLEGQFLDVRPSDKNLAFAMEYAESPALIGQDENNNSFARILPLVFPATTENSSEIIREIQVYSRDAKWSLVEEWFNGGPVAPSQFQMNASESIVFDVDQDIDGNIATSNNTDIEAPINFDNIGNKMNTQNQRVAGFNWEISTVEVQGDNFVLPTFYRLNANNEWVATLAEEVPESTGLTNTTPQITPRNDDVPYLTPLEPDCHLQDPNSPWNSPGPVAGPFNVSLGDGSRLTYYWYKFIDQPALIHANLPDEMRANIQARVELIHTHWSPFQDYLPEIEGGALVDLDAGLLVNPPEGLEIGYVPIVTRQEKDSSITAVGVLNDKKQVIVYPNPTPSYIQIECTQQDITEIKLTDGQGKLIKSWPNVIQKRFLLNLENYQNGLYILQVRYGNGNTSTHQIIKQ